MVDDNSSPVLVEVTQEIAGHGILPLKVPSSAAGTCILQTLINCTTKGGIPNIGEDDHCELKSSSEMRIVGPVREVIIRPSKNAYRPEETVSFWIMALDHDLQIASGTIGTISVKDPQGTKVAIWDQVAFDEGVLAYTLPLSPYALTGRWTIIVDVEQSQFFSTFEVAPGIGIGQPDVSVAEEHYVELKFGTDMRRRYKPGLPFSGKVEAMSTEKSVRVRVKVYDNTTSIYSQDIEISNGEGTFMVPAIMADSDVIHLQAELVSVESKEIESHYILAREPIRKWNSSSDCYLLIEGVEHTLQPEEEAYVTILSTCPCERDVHYVITTDGRITDWAPRGHEQIVPLDRPSMAPGPTCKLHFSFPVQSVMAPVSQLLVYYLTPQGEPISDVISFGVKLFDKGVSVHVENREWWLPDQSVDLEVIAEPSSLVCLLGGRSEAANDLRFDPRISEEPTPSPITEEVDFLEAGVSYFQRECSKRGDSGMSAISYRQRGSGAGPSGQKRRPPESLVGGSPYDHLWMWTCFNYSSNSSSTELSINTPKEAGKWSIWALTVSRAGLRFSAPVKLEVFRPLTVDFHLPPSLKVREILEVDIKIGNNINSCVDVTALLALSEGAEFISNGLLYVTERLRLGPHGATSLVVKILFITPGTKNLTVEVNGYASSTCEGRENISNSTLSGAVIHSATLEVYSGGCEKIHTESSYFCANEELMFSTRDNFNYEWMQAPKNRESMVVEVKVSRSKNLGPVHIVLAECKTQADKMYTITIGDADNTLSHIGRGNHHLGIQLTSSETPDILGEDTWKPYWITWSNNVISFGAGSSPSNRTLLTWKMDSKVKVMEIGFASAWGALAGFRVWSFYEEDGLSEILHLDRIRNAVADSQRGDLTFVGGLAIPRISKLDGGGLVGALASLTPLLTVSHQEVREPHDQRPEIVKVLPETIQTILSFKKQDNSFSEHSMLGSHRATVSVLEALSKIQLHFNIDPDLIQAIKRWVQLRQEDDGRFTPLVGDLKLMDTNSSKGGLRRNLSAEVFHFENIVEITAETVIALYEIGIETDADSDTLQKAKIFLENSLPNVESPETIAAVAFALVLVRSATAAWAVEKLRNASTTEDGEFGWPNFSPKRDAADWLYESESQNTFGPVPCIATVEEYRASLYALSTFCIIGDLKSAQSVATFLVNRSYILDNHYELLYSAVTAFSEYNSMANDRYRALTIALATSGMEFTETLHFNKHDSYYKVDLPSLPTKILLYATGAGCATIQGRAFYSTYANKDKTTLLEIRSEIVEEILPDRSSIEEIEGKLPTIKIETCFKWKGDHPSPVLRLEVDLFSGFEVSPNPPQLLNPPQKMAEMQHGNRGNKLWFIFANVSTPCPVCVQYSARSSFVIAAIRPAYAKIYPVSREDLAADVFFHARGISALRNSVSNEDMESWFGSSKSLFTIPAGCLKKNVATAPRSIPGEVEVHSKEVKLVKLMEYTIGADNQSDRNTLSEATTQNANPSTANSIFPTADQFNVTIISQTAEPTTIEPVKFYKTKKVVETKFRKVLLGQVQTGKEITKNPPTQNSKLERKVFKNASKETLKREKVSEIIDNQAKLPRVTSPTPSPEPRTHQTITIPTTKSSKVRNKLVQKIPNHPNTIVHVNTEQIHDIPQKLVKSKMEDDNNNVAEHEDSQYVLLNKDSLWDMLKEAVSDDVKRKELTNILREKEK